MSTVGWFHCFSGIAGDMALAATIDAGAPVDEIVAMCRALPVTGWSLEAEPVTRCGVAGTKAHVRATETTVVRTFAHIADMLDDVALPPRVVRRALAAFGALAEAEGALHRRPASQVHFHEVGALDALIDIVGTCAGLELLDVDDVWSSPVAVGLGMHRSAHGLLPNPAPATVELLRGAPVKGLDLPVELTTPTGAALLRGLDAAFGALPPMQVRRTGFGAGTAEMDGRPNLLQLVIGTAEQGTQPGRPGTGQSIVELSVNVDDATGEVLAHVVARLLQEGALDAWVTPMLMKKGRPAHTITVLADLALAERLTGVLTSESGSLGVRGRVVERWPAARSTDTVTVDGHVIRIKVAAGRAKPEWDDVAAAATALGRPARQVLAEAEAIWAGDLGPRSARPQDHDHPPAG